MDFVIEKLSKFFDFAIERASSVLKLHNSAPLRSPLFEHGSDLICPHTIPICRRVGKMLGGRVSSVIHGRPQTQSFPPRREFASLPFGRARSLDLIPASAEHKLRGNDPHLETVPT
jgi:hypothetical protein